MLTVIQPEIRSRKECGQCHKDVTLHSNHYPGVPKSEGLVHMTKVLLAAHSRQVTILKNHIQHTQQGIGRYHCLLAFCVHGTLCVHDLNVSMNHTGVSPLDTSWSKQYIKCTQITVKR